MCVCVCVTVFLRLKPLLSIFLQHSFKSTLKIPC